MSRGFTLLELMIALAIVGMLSALAWPGYRAAMHRSHRVEARLALLQIQFRQEQHYASHNAYAASLVAAAGPGGLGMPSRTASQNYELSMMVDGDAQGFTAIARINPAGRQAGDRDCEQLAVDHTGTRHSSAADGVWRDAAVDTCWG